MINTHGGGAQTNINGLKFERETQLSEAMAAAGFTVKQIDTTKNGAAQTHELLDENQQLIGLLTQKHGLYKHFLEPNGIPHTILSAQLQPDEAFINYKNKTVYIIEKKYQAVSGTADEKLQTCPFKLRQYRRLFTPLGYDVKYMYVLNDWFTKPKYKDVLDFIRECECDYYFGSIPMNCVGL